MMAPVAPHSPGRSWSPTKVSGRWAVWAAWPVGFRRAWARN